MKVRVLSDLHLEFSKEYMEIPEGDVLVLAGDICIGSEVEKYHDFFSQCVDKYNKVFYVLGNHEHYAGTWEETFWTIQQNIPHQISILNNRSECYDGVHFIGGTLWTNYDNLNLNTMKQAQDCMTDYYSVRKKDGRNITPVDVLDEHMFTRNWFEQAIPTLRGDVFVVTHHAPSQQSVRGRYKALQGAYANNMESYGHVHKTNDYDIGECRVISNPRGYFGMEMNPDFSLDKEYEV